MNTCACEKLNPIMMMHKDKTETDFNEMKQFMRPTGVEDGQDIIHSGAGHVRCYLATALQLTLLLLQKQTIIFLNPILSNLCIIHLYS